MMYFVLCAVFLAVILASVYLWERQLTIADLLVFGLLSVVPVVNVACVVVSIGATFNYLVDTDKLNRFLGKRVL